MSKKTSTLYEFEEFRLDAEKKCLWHSGEMVSLTPKALETLIVLIKNRGEIVSKDDLLSAVWADTFVEESTLSQNILTLRKTLGAFQKDKQFIVTVPRRGFRFAADVREISGDEEFFVVEKHTRTRIVAEQTEIQDSAGEEKNTTAIVSPDEPDENSRNFRKYEIAAAAALPIVFVLIAGFIVQRFYFSTQDFVESKFQKFRVVNLLSGAGIKKAILSPNGKYLALIEEKNETQTLFLRQIENGNAVELVSKPGANFIGATFSPDGEQIFYSIYENANESSVLKGALYKAGRFD